MIVISKYLVPKGYLGMALFPFLFIKCSDLKSNAVFLNHEKIHFKQQLELLVIPFYLFYFLEFVFRLLQYQNWQKAYLNISFEREAYSNQKDLDYLKSRSCYRFLKYL